MKGCELCGSAARMFCESDQAILCWDCDEKVHSANFLVAKHSRILLCQVCQSPTPWKASGSKLGPTVSICESCFAVHNNNNDDDDDDDDERNLQVENHMSGDQESHEVGDEADESKTDQLFDDDETDGEYDDEEEDEDYDDEEEEEEGDEDGDGDNQVVPWSGAATSASSLVPPLATSTSSEEEEISCAGRNGFLKRIRDSNADLDSDDEIGCSSSADLIGGRLSNEEDGNPLGSFRPWKQPRTSAVVEDDGQQVSRSTAIIESLKRLQRDMVTDGENASAAILGICRLSRDQSR